MSNGLTVSDVHNFEFKNITSRALVSKRISLFVFSCGYESRALAQLKHIIENDSSGSFQYLCFSYESFKEFGSRRENEIFLAKSQIDINEVSTKDWSKALQLIRGCIDSNSGTGVDLYIDYSSMPRNWYCKFAENMVLGKLGDSVFMSYTHGKFFAEEFPCVGYGEFTNFSGRPRVTSNKETYIFGLGFDSIRTYGIWSYLDPQVTVSILARLPKTTEHYDRVLEENTEILSASDMVLDVNLSDFQECLSFAIDVVRKYRTHGDVCLVPDGPKPLVAAMSIAPFYFSGDGVYSWHVGHVKPFGYQPVNVESSGEFSGFGIGIR